MATSPRTALTLVAVLCVTSCSTMEQTYENNPKAVLGAVIGAAAGAGIAAAAGGSPGSLGIDRSRLKVQGYGTASAAASNATPMGRSRNSRVEVTVL